MQAQAALPLDIATQIMRAAEIEGLSIDEFILQLILAGWRVRDQQGRAFAVAPMAKLDQFHEQLADLCLFALKARAEHCVTSMSEAIRRETERPLKRLLSVRQRVEDPYTGAVATARMIGDVVVSLAGWNSLAAARDRIEREVGPREAEWLSRRWVGIEGPDGEVWSD